jgi:hypothetical protein
MRKKQQAKKKLFFSLFFPNLKEKNIFLRSFVYLRLPVGWGKEKRRGVSISNDTIESESREGFLEKATHHNDALDALHIIKEK